VLNKIYQFPNTKLKGLKENILKDKIGAKVKRVQSKKEAM
jgi:hypothetical protein